MMHYHEVTMSFNWWMLALPLFMAAMGVLGFKRFYFKSTCETCLAMKVVGKCPKLNKDAEAKCHPIRKLNSKYTWLEKGLAAAFAVIMLTMIIRESIRGILQLCINMLGPDDDIAWAVMLSTMALIAIPVACYYLFVFSARVGEFAGLGYLMEQRRKAIAGQKAIEESKQTKRRFGASSEDEADDGSGSGSVINFQDIPQSNGGSTEDPDVNSGFMQRLESYGMDFESYEMEAEEAFEPFADELFELETSGYEGAGFFYNPIRVDILRRI